MKIICLNIWGGKLYEPLIEFVKEQSASTDIFCFQEVFRSPRKDIEKTEKTRIHILDELVEALPDFNYFFHTTISGVDNSGLVDFDIDMGQAEFVKKNISVTSSGEIKIYSGKTGGAGYEFSPRNFGYSRIGSGDQAFTVLNVHGTTRRGDDKLDNPERLEQSRIIKEFALNEKNKVIICGDFNILPEQKSITMFGDSFVDLVKKYGITTTRSVISPWHGTPNEMKFSDYAFVSPSLEITGFSVPDPEISDHLPLIIEFR